MVCDTAWSDRYRLPLLYLDGKESDCAIVLNGRQYDDRRFKSPGYRRRRLSAMVVSRTPLETRQFIVGTFAWQNVAIYNASCYQCHVYKAFTSDDCSDFSNDVEFEAEASGLAAGAPHISELVDRPPEERAVKGGGGNSFHDISQRCVKTHRIARSLGS